LRVGIELDRAREALDQLPTYVLGETLTGRVEVSVDQAVRCDGLDVELLYVRSDHHQSTPRTYGFGELEPEHHSRGARLRLFEGTWSPSTHSYSFAVPVPFPMSYDGQKSSWSWVAYCRANVPWAADSVDRAYFRVGVPEAARAHQRYTVLPPERSGGASTASVLLKHAGGFVGAPAFGVAVCGLLASAIGAPWEWPAVVGAVLGLLLAVYVVLRDRSRARVRGPELVASVIDPAEAYRASAEAAAPLLRCRAVPGAGTTVEYVAFELSVRENTTVRRVSHDNRTSDRPVHTVLWSSEQRVEHPAGDDAFYCDLPMPPPGTLPFSTGRDELGRGIVWQISANVVRAVGNVEVEESVCEIDVRPEIVRAPALADRLGSRHTASS
jgi:hypothetical protein